ncbi:endonuclease NucS domain-containing protein [Methylolobus aquaticus]
MKKEEYERWLQTQKYQSNTITAQLHRAGRVEEYYGDLDEHYKGDQLASVIAALVYSTEDRRRNRPNPTKIPFQGDPYNNLASYRDAVKRYQKFRIEQADVPVSGERAVIEPKADEENEPGQRIGLERDMQAALRLRIDQLEPGLKIADEGAERSVESGFIDITASDASGEVVVIELKTGVAGQRAIAQILSYMGDVAVENEGTKVRGILVAAEFDAKAKAAARMVPNLSLRKYSVHFKFSDGNG